MQRRNQRLQRDTNDNMIGGVCSGLGHYFDIDTTLVRVAFVAFTMVGGGGLLGYLILWVVLDPAPPGFWDSMESTTSAGNPAAVPPSPAVPDVIDVEHPQPADPVPGRGVID